MWRRLLLSAFASILACALPLHAQGSPDTPGAVVRRLYNCFNHHHIEGCAALYADTVVVLPDDDTIARRIPKHDVLAVVGKFLADNPGARVEASLSVIGPFVTSRERLINWPDRKTRNGLDVFDVQHGEIVALWEVPERPGSAK